MRGFKSEKLNVSDNQCIVLLKSLSLVNIYFEKSCGKCRFFKPKRTIACYHNCLFAPLGVRRKFFKTIKIKIH